jgi:hypothetical protein
MKIKQCSEFDSLGVVRCSTMKSPKSRSYGKQVDSRHFESFVSEHMRRDIPKCRSPEMSEMTWTYLEIDSSTIFQKVSIRRIIEVSICRSDVT